RAQKLVDRRCLDEPHFLGGAEDRGCHGAADIDVQAGITPAFVDLGEPRNPRRHTTGEHATLADPLEMPLGGDCGGEKQPCCDCAATFAKQRHTARDPTSSAFWWTRSSAQ